MPLPALAPAAIPIITAAASFIREMTSYAAQENRALAIERKYMIEHKRIELDGYKEQLRNELELEKIDLKRERLRRQYEIIVKTLELSQHVFDRKIDAFTLSFEQTSSLIQSERAALKTEFDDLQERLFSDEISRSQRAYINKRRHEVRLERQILLDLYSSMRVDFEKNISILSLEQPKYGLFFNDQKTIG